MQWRVVVAVWRCGAGMYETVIVGAGPGGTGPLICAAQQGSLTDWLEAGVAIVDQGSRIGGSLHRYAINSNSMGRSYLECFDHAPFFDLFAELRREETTQRLYEYVDRLPPLPLVGAFLQRQGYHLERLIARFPASRFLAGTRLSAYGCSPVAASPLVWAAATRPTIWSAPVPFWQWVAGR